MPPSTRNHDPFIDAPRRPASRATQYLQQQQHQQDQEPQHGPLRATTTSTNGPGRNLFAPPPVLSRRPTAASASRSAANTGNSHILEDAENGEQQSSALTIAGPSTRRVAAGRTSRTRRTRANTDTTVEPDDDFGRGLVVRDKSGHYVPKVEAPGGESIISKAEAEHLVEAARLTASASDFWASGAGIGGGRGSRRLDEEDHKTKEEIMERLRVDVSRKLAADRWMFEPTDYFEDLRLKHNGV